MPALTAQQPSVTSIRQTRFRRVSLILAAYVISGGLSSFMGWAMNVERLADWDGDGVATQPNTAVCAVGGGAALFFFLRRRNKMAGYLGIASGLIALAAFCEHLFRVNFGIDALLLFDRSWGGLGTMAPGRMGPPGALSWTLVGTALALLGLGRSSVRRFVPPLAILVCLIAALSQIGYAYGADRLYRIPRLTAIAFQTSTFLLAMGFGLLAAQPHREPLRSFIADTNSGMLARRAVPFLVMIPVLLGFLLLRGEKAGLYDPALGTAFLVLALIVLTISVLWWRISSLNKRERELGDAVLARQKSDAALYEALLAADKHKDEFLATLAHELRNPLAPIRNAGRLLERASVDPQIKWVREVIERQVGQMARLLDDLLDLSRISQDKMELRRERIELGTLLENALETSRPLIDSRRHELELILPPGTLELYADPGRLAQVFSNLLDNAAKYSDIGTHIRLLVERQDGEILVSVSDNGPGIDPLVLPHLFDMFAQDRRLLERSRGGLGVGLTLSRRILELHGGSIEAQSEGLGKGSTFMVRLPLATEAVSQPSRAESEVTPAAAGLRILVIDDLEDNADTLGTLLESRGNEVRVAYSGQDALRIAQVFRPEVVFLDLGMPDMNGYDLCRDLRRETWGREACLVALTGWGQEADRRRTLEAGFDHHLVKPVDLDALLEIVASISTRLVKVNGSSGPPLRPAR